MEWLNPQNAAILITAVLTGVGGTAFVQAYFNKNKTASEARNLDITGDMQIGKSWQEYADQQKRDKEELRKELLSRLDDQRKYYDKEIKELKDKFNEVLLGKDVTIAALTASNYEYKTRTNELLKELERYRNMEKNVCIAQEKLHHDVDTAAENIINHKQ